MAAIGGHQRAYQGRSDEWLTPPEIVQSLGKFELDPCAPCDRPWDTASRHYTVVDDGLSMDWHGRVWLNPPYGPATDKWLRKLSEHGDGVALIFARTETEMFFKYVWGSAHAVLFLKGRLHFYSVSGIRAKSNSGAPSVLVAYGADNAVAIKSCGIPGRFIPLMEF